MSAPPSLLGLTKFYQLLILGGGRDSKVTSFPEIGRVYQRVQKEAREHGKEATAFRYWRAIEAFRKRCHAKVIKDPKGRNPQTERPAAIEAFLERAKWRHHDQIT